VARLTGGNRARTDHSLEKYLQEISEVPLLTPEEEIELAKCIKKGDEEALERLTKANLRFVVSVAKQYQNQGLSLGDLINEGNLNSFRMQCGGSGNPFCRHWQSNRVWCGCL
jgi:RNA polymerase primary sigma factor